MSRPGPKRRPRGLPFALVCAAACLAWSWQASAQEYAEAMVQAQALEGEGEYAAAAAALRLILPLYEQDNPLLLRIAADELLAGRYKEAEQAYRRGLHRWQWPEESYLGLGLALEGQGACTGARVSLRSALVLSPGEPSALAALDRCAGQEDWQIVPQGALTGQYFRGDPLKDFAAGGALGLSAGYLRSWQLKLLYRILASPGTTPNPGWVQHEVFAAAGYGRQRYGVELSYAFVHSGNDYMGDSNHLGLAVRYSPLGDLSLNTAVSIYNLPSLSAVLRGELSWRIPLGSVISLRPAVAAYFSNLTLAPYPCTYTMKGGQAGPVSATCTDTGNGLVPGHVMGSLTLYASGRRGTLWLGGKFGDEFRSAYMDLPAFYDVPYHVAAGAWVGGEVPLDRRWSLSVRAAWDRYFSDVRADQPGGEIDRLPTVPDGFYLTLGAARRF